MADKDLGEELDNIEGEIDNLKNKEFKLFGLKMTPMTIGAAFAALSSIIGALYAGFTMYQQIEEIASLDLASYQQQMTETSQQIEIQSKLLRSIEDNLRDTKQLTYDIEKRVNDKVVNFERKMDRFEQKVDKNKEELEDKLQKALDNPLAN
jgi:Holliday junction resolvasome RuvABC ATP-dependent DNA helicase subunit